MEFNVIKCLNSGTAEQLLEKQKEQEPPLPSFLKRRPESRFEKKNKEEEEIYLRILTFTTIDSHSRDFSEV